MGFLLLLGVVLAVQPGQRLPEFALLDPQGKLVTPATMKKPAVIVFWASWC
ncbi:thiol-disulfide isomerase, partial [Thermus scotoductus]